MSVKLRRLFEPALANKKVVFKEMVEATVGYLGSDTLPILAIPFLIGLLSQGLYNYAIIVCFVVFGIHVLFWILNAYIRSWDIDAKYAMNEYIEKTYRRKVLLKDHKAFDLIGTGKVQSIIQKGMDDWSELDWQVTYQIPRIFVGIGTGVYVMLKFETQYLIAFLVLIVCAYLSYTKFKILKKRSQEKSNDTDDVTNAASVRSIMSRQEIVFSGKVDKEVDNFVNLNNESKTHAYKAEQYEQIANTSIESTGPIISLLFIAFLLYQSVATGNVTVIDVSSLIFLIYFASRFVNLMYLTSWIISVVLERLPKIQKFWKFLDETPDLEKYEKGDVFEQKNTSIVFDNVTFAYGDKKVLENFSVSTPHGKKIALVGKSGSGKTTIAKLISGYMYADTGHVLIDGQDIKNLSLKSYYKHIGYLTQEPMVFDGSIRDNLLYVLDDSSDVGDEVLLEALKKAECDFVTDLNVQIGEKGIRLSGGERQRLAIAKLFLKNPEIVILDEPTSALDSFSEEKITKALDELFKGKTVIIIAHRLQTIKKADTIFVIEEGKIIEEGKHSTLIGKKGVYYKMVELQSGF